MTQQMQSQTAVFGGGCFWCTEAMFQNLEGVQTVVSGYSGGTVDNPSYEQVCTGQTGHAEVIKIEFDPGTISYRTLLEVFFTTHDPTTMNRQGNDVGTQYRSVVFYSTDEQKQVAQDFIQGLEESKAFSNPIVTKLERLQNFYPAEQYHQNYFNQNANQPYCQVVINPKLEKFKKKYGSLLEK